MLNLDYIITTGNPLTAVPNDIYDSSLFVLAYIEDFCGYDVIMMSFREKEMCKIAPLPIGQFHLPK